MTTFTVPENPGTKITWVGETTVAPPAAISDTVAILVTHDWGPLREVTELQSFADWESIFGNSDSDGRDAVLGAFVGNGVPGSGAQAGSVLVYRMGDDTAATALLHLQKTGPANAVTLTARYEGTRGNDLSAVVESDPVDPTNKDRLRILLDDVTVERYSYAKASTDVLVDAINTRSKYVTAVQDSAGALTHVSATPLAGGDDGTPVTVTEYQDGLDAVEFSPFSVLAFSNLTDSAIMAAVQSWVDTQDDEMRPVEVVFGGPDDETLTEALTRTAAFNDFHVVSIGAGNLHDDFLDKDISFAKFAPRVAGALAGIGEKRALTYLPFAGITLLDPIEVPTDSLRLASDSGLTALTRASVAGADLVVNRGVTTFTDELDLVHPIRIFSDPRLVRILDLFLRRVKQRGDSELIGLPNSEETRAAAADIGKAELAQLVTDGLIVNTQEDAPFFRVLDNDPDNPDMIRFEFGWLFTYTTNFLVGVGRIR